MNFFIKYLSWMLPSSLLKKIIIWDIKRMLRQMDNEKLNKLIKALPQVLRESGRCEDISQWEELAQRIMASEKAAEQRILHNTEVIK